MPVGERSVSTVKACVSIQNCPGPSAGTVLLYFPLPLACSSSVSEPSLLLQKPGGRKAAVQCRKHKGPVPRCLAGDESGSSGAINSTLASTRHDKAPSVKQWSAAHTALEAAAGLRADGLNKPPSTPLQLPVCLPQPISAFGGVSDSQPRERASAAAPLLQRVEGLSVLPRLCARAWHLYASEERKRAPPKLPELAATLWLKDFINPRAPSRPPGPAKASLGTRDALYAVIN
ncbi:hypothetical protein AAFF_G00258720 [Aldrovandia affinis]|uniref:Uncharacterized protein n=1 Tax=Aldrovandia affinis TaxID=143900 RepID=A0AAD7STM6_9TELE|nr:hypothetical protein AAFF_G00258720 [Aldrovandia affinis]